MFHLMRYKLKKNKKNIAAQVYLPPKRYTPSYPISSQIRSFITYISLSTERLRWAFFLWWRCFLWSLAIAGISEIESGVLVVPPKPTTDPTPDRTDFPADHAVDPIPTTARLSSPGRTGPSGISGSFLVKWPSEWRRLLSCRLLLFRVPVASVFNRDSTFWGTDVTSTASAIGWSSTASRVGDVVSPSRSVFRMASTNSTPSWTSGCISSDLGSTSCPATNFSSSGSGFLGCKIGSTTECHIRLANPGWADAASVLISVVGWTWTAGFAVGSGWGWTTTGETSVATSFLSGSEVMTFLADSPSLTGCKIGSTIECHTRLTSPGRAVGSGVFFTFLAVAIVPTFTLVILMEWIRS